MYAFVNNNIAYGPSGPIKDVEGTPLEAKDAAEYNRQVEAQEIAHLKMGPERVFLYVKYCDGGPVPRIHQITTWLGTVVSSDVVIGDQRVCGFQAHTLGGTFRRHVTARIFGVLYHGWYYESSGQYCRLKRAKRQT